MKFVVTSHYGTKGEKSEVWDAAQPLPIGHPFQYMLEKTPKGFRLRDLNTPIDQIQKQAVQDISAEILKSGKAIQVQDRSGLQGIHIRSLSELQPIHQQKNKTPSTQSQLRIFTCVGHWVQKAETFQGDFTAIHEGKKIFTLKKTGKGIQIQTWQEGVELQNGKTQNLPNNERFVIEGDNTAQHSLHFNGISWHLNTVETPQLVQTGTIQTDAESIWFKKSLISASTALAALVLLVFLMPNKKAEEEELIPTQFAQIIMEQKDEGPEPSEAKGDQQPPVAKAENAAVVQAFRAEALQSAVGGLLKGGMTTLLAQSDLVSGKASNQARAIFDAPSKALNPTSNLVGLKKSKAVDVAAFGGQARKGGTGYGKGKRAGISGQGTNFVALDTGGSYVDSGLSKDEVGRVIHSHMSEVRYCYESSMIQNPEVQGKLSVKFSISGTGKVSTAAVNSSTTEFPRLDDCVIRRLAKWKFPKPKGGVTVAVSYPFIFKKLGR